MVSEAVRSVCAHVWLLVLVSFLAGVVGCGGDAAPTGMPTSTATATATATATPDLSATVVPELGDELQPLNSFKASYGDPPEADRGRIRIPRIGVDAAIAERTVGADLDLSRLNPYGPADVIWYNFGTTAEYGGEPGSGENAIFSGHVDYAYQVAFAGAYYQGAGVFAGFKLLQPNDAIEITMDGKTTRYGVVWVREVEDDADFGALFRAKQPEGDAITLITCTGDFDPATQTYSSRIVVRATRY